MKSKISTTKDADLAKWCAALATKIATDTVPPGWYPASELATKLGKSRARMGEKLSLALRDGLCERRDFRLNVNGRSRPVPHYKLK